MKSLFIIFLLVLLRKQTQAQTFQLQSFDGKKQVVKVSVAAGRDVLNLITGKDTLKINDCMVLEEAIVLNKSFIRLVYTMRGGTGINTRGLLIVGCKDNRLYQAVHIVSLYHEEFIDFSKKKITLNAPDVITNYAVKVKLSGDKYPVYKMNVAVHAENTEKDNPGKSYNRTGNVMLNFDTVNNVFYSGRTKIAKHFKMYNVKTGKHTRPFIKGDFPTIKLDSYKYYYASGTWYEENDYGDLIMLSYR
jgi:hypothetical protein